MAGAKSCDKRKYFRLWDLIPISLVVIVFLSGLWNLLSSHNEEGHLTAVISVNSEEFCRVDLSGVKEAYDLEVPTSEGVVVVHIAPDGVCVKDSPCPDKVCVNTGKLTRSGQSAVCLPERVSVKLLTAEEGPRSQPDAVAG